MSHRPHDNLFAELLIECCRYPWGQFWLTQIQGMLHGIALDFNEKLSQGAAASIVMGPLNRPGSLSQSKKSRGGIGL